MLTAFDSNWSLELLFSFYASQFYHHHVHRGNSWMLPFCYIKLLLIRLRFLYRLVYHKLHKVFAISLRQVRALDIMQDFCIHIHRSCKIWSFEVLIAQRTLGQLFLHFRIILVSFLIDNTSVESQIANIYLGAFYAAGRDHYQTISELARLKLKLRIELRIFSLVKYLGLLSVLLAHKDPLCNLINILSVLDALLTVQH